MYQLSSCVDVQSIISYGKKSKSRICGFIVYSSIHADVVKVINDDDYYNEFHDLSGTRWPIFVIRPLEPKRKKLEGGSSLPGCTSYMHFIDEEPESNINVLNFFGLNDSYDTPCFVLFSWDNKGHLVSYNCKIELGGVEKVHNSIREIIDEIRKSEEQILPSYRQGEGVYREAQRALENLNKRRWRKKTWSNLSIAETVISGIMSLIP